MKTTATLTLALLLCLITTQTHAAVHVDESGDTYHEERITRKFTLTGDGKNNLRLTLSCTANKSSKGTLRVNFYQRSPQGGWNQIDKLRIQINKTQKQTSDTFTLPAGEYMVQMRVRRMEYSFKLEDEVE